MSYDDDTLNGGGKFWSEKMNDEGFMGFVDKWWIFWNRVGTVMVIVLLIVSILVSIFTISKGTESFGTSRLRHQNRRYT